MYAVIKTGGKQYRVSEGQKLLVEKIPGQNGDKVTLDQVLFVGGDSAGDSGASDSASASSAPLPKIGQPFVKGASVAAEIVEQGRGKKIVVFKFRRRKNYRRKTGHRQPFTALKITAIAVG